MEYDVIVIGGGPPGENAAGRVTEHGLTAALVEKELVGGECSYWACMPSKSLLRPIELLDEVKAAQGLSHLAHGTGIDVPSVLDYRDDMTSHWNDDGQVKWLQSAKVDLIRGTGRVAGERQVEVEDGNGDRQIYTAKKAVVLATGSVPVRPPIPGLDAVPTWDSRAATSAKEAPRRLVILGGGVVAVEMAQAWKGLGAQDVTLLVHGSRLLDREEEFAADFVAERLREHGITVVFDTEVVKADREGDGARLTLSSGSSIDADVVLVATGRRPNTHDIGLPSVGLGEDRIEVDDNLRVTGVDGDWLYAVGDVTGLALLTHMGKYQARIVSDIIVGKDAVDRADHGIVPRVVFTSPPLAAVGLTEEQARAAGHKVKAVEYDLANVSGTYLLGADLPGRAKLVVDKETRTILGMTIVGTMAAELIHAATVAIAGRVTIDDLWHAVPSFPTVSEIWLRLLEEYGL